MLSALFTKDFKNPYVQAIQMIYYFTWISITTFNHSQLFYIYTRVTYEMEYLVPAIFRKYYTSNKSWEIIPIILLSHLYGRIISVTSIQVII